MRITSMALALGFVAWITPAAQAAAHQQDRAASGFKLRVPSFVLAQAEADPASGDPGPMGVPDAADADDAVSGPVSDATNYSHRHQFGLAIMPGTGFRLIVPYEDPKGPTAVECGDATDPDRRVCTGRSPVFVDLQAAFGVSNRIDLVVDLRFGLEKDFTDTRQFALMPGLRVWMDQDVALKLYAMIQFVWDNTKQEQVNIENTDFGFRPSIGLMYDVIRNFGIYGQLGATFGFARWFRIEADAGVGVQVRFP